MSVLQAIIVRWPEAAGIGADALILDYIERSVRLGAPHGPDCPCFMDATIRADIRHVPLPIEPWDLIGKRWMR